MSSLFIIGNGFDLAHGLPTRYSDFKKYLETLYHPVSEIDRPLYIEDLIDANVYDIAVELLFYAMENTTDDNWSDFENALGKFNFHKKFPQRKSTDEYGNYNDDNIVEYLQMSDIIGNMFIQGTQTWQDLFSDWIKSVQRMIENGSCIANPKLLNLFSEEGSKFLTFNYTKTLQEVYGVKKVIHIHNRKGQKLIFGHGIENPEYNDFVGDGTAIMCSFLNDMLLDLKKDTDKQLKKYKDFFKYLDNSIDKVYSYGFSYCKVDSIYIKKIIEKISNDSIWYFNSYEAQDTESLRIKKIRLRNYGFKGTFGLYEI